MPESLPISILAQPLPRSFIDTQVRRKTADKVSGGESRLQLGMSDRLLRNIFVIVVRSTSGLNRNYFSKITSQKNCNPRLTTNNFFASSSLPESNKKAKQIIMQGNFDTNYVKKWVDYSSKYGLGYLLSNKSTGIYFNDCTKIIIQPNGQYIKIYAEMLTISVLLANYHSIPCPMLQTKGNSLRNSP